MRRLVTCLFLSFLFFLSPVWSFVHVSNPFGVAEAFASSMVLGNGQWSLMGGKKYFRPLGLSLELPIGWLKIINTQKNTILLTRNGHMLQEIWITRLKMGKKLPNTEKVLSKDMLPHELAEYYIGSFRNNIELGNQRVVENSPATIDSHAGFRLLLHYKSREGLKRKLLSYGFIYDKWYYQINYFAPERYYFGKDLEEFEEVVKSFELEDTSYLDEDDDDF